MSVVQARFVRRTIEDRFDGLLDLSDLSTRPPDAQQQAFLSRGLAALAVQIEHPSSDAVAAQAVFDGQDDQGLDAIAFDTQAGRPTITLVQAKWSDSAKGGFGEAEVHKMLNGLDLILDFKFSYFNRRFQPHVAAAQAAFDVTTPRITLLADMFEEHRRGLFARNIRESLDFTDVNNKIRQTLLSEPENLWYFSNGITMLCDSIKPVGRPVLGHVGEFQLSGASVVNGAQTVSAIHKAYAADPSIAERGRVLVRLISLEDCPPGFGEQVTTSTNTQNPIVERDFKALDPAQLALRDQFAIDLSLIYVIKRGEPVPDAEHGTSITAAVEALAATHANAEFAARAKRDLSSLWQDDAYGELFGAAPNAHRVWRSVLVVRAARHELARLREGLVSRADAMAVTGDLLISHVVFRQLDHKRIEDPEFHWDKELERIPSLVEGALIRCLEAINAEFGVTSHIIAAVKNSERIERVAQAAIDALLTGDSVPELDSEYQVSVANRKSRQTDTVKVLVAAGTIADGTVLEFRPFSRPERREMTDWLAEDAARSLAIWRNSKRNQVQWQADGKWYSPSGLVRQMRAMASGRDQAVQGTLHWHVPDRGSLKQIGDAVQQEQDAAAAETS